MKRFLSLFAILIASAFGFVNTATADTGGSGIQWYTNYDEALKAARSSSKPLLVLFTGSDWCSWCIKLEKEVFNTPDFDSAANSKFVFLKLDFPMHTTIPADQTAKNKAIQRKFKVTGYPTVVLVDSKTEKTIGSTGYRAGGGKQYADFLNQMLSKNAAYQAKISNLDKQPIIGVALKDLYEHASELGFHSDMNTIVALGMLSEQKHFFMLERYRLLAEQGLLHSNEAAEIRQKLLASDPNNHTLTHYQVAVIDFEAMWRATGIENPPELTVASLVDYIDKFGANDKSHLWHLHMVISQVFFDTDNLPEALRYAQSSYQSAPATVQPEIATAIKNIESMLSINK